MGIMYIKTAELILKQIDEYMYLSIYHGTLLIKKKPDL